MKLILLLFSSILINLPLIAQFQITPQIGLIMSKVKPYKETVHLYSQQFNHYGLSIGINTSKHISEHWMIAADFFYNEKGADVNGSANSDGDFLEIKANFFETGISANYKCFENIAVEAGPYYAHLLELTSFSQFFGYQRPPNDETSRYNDEFGISIGGSYEVYNFSIRLRYSFGIFGYKSGYKNQMFVLSIGYGIEL